MSEIHLLPPDPIIGIRDLVLSHQPTNHARMTAPGYNAKYLRVPEPITDADLAAHLAGDVTLAAVLQRDDLATVAAVDIDTGGEAMVRKVMRMAELRACHAYGFVLDSGGHDGGHVWIFFDQAHASHDLQVLMRDIVADAQCLTTEIYPNGADLRLPFGVHRRCGRRGTLLLHSAAAPLDLDADLAGALASFLATVRRTSDLPVRVAQEAQQARRAAVAESIAASRPRQCPPDSHWRESIAYFNASTDLAALLESYGARAVYHYAGGKVLMRCAASQDHAHGDKHPSLIVEPGRGQQTGRMICGCYSPLCRLHNRPGQVMDAFEVFCRLENISKREGVQRITHAVGAKQAARPSSTTTPNPALPPASPTMPSMLPSPLNVAQRRLVDLSTDRRAQPLDRRLLAYVIANDAQGQGIANATIAAALGARPDSIKRAKRRLRELGYIDVVISVDGVSPSAITIIGVPSASDSPPSAGGLGGVAGGCPSAPPSHVSESTCVAETPPRESELELQERTVGEGVQMPSASLTTAATPPARPEAALRRRRSVLLNMIRAGVPERRRLAFTAELAAIEAQLGPQVTTVAQLPLDTEQGASYQEPTIDDQPVPSEDTTSSHIQIARPNDPHPAMTDAQLTAVLYDALCDTLTTKDRMLLERISWHQDGDQVALVCAARDLAPVTGQLLTATRRALADLGLPGVVRVQLGQPTPVGVRPLWIDDALWARVPVWARGVLVGSVVVEGTLYGATSQRTAALAAYRDVVDWLVVPAQG